MKITFFIIIIILLIIGLLLFYNSKDNNPHQKKPNKTTEQHLPDGLFEKLVNSDYANGLKLLSAHVSGHKVVNSIVGNAGFILRLDNNSWASAYRKDSSILSDFGTGEISTEFINKIKSEEFGDASDFINEDRPYANNKNDIKSEIKKSYGNVLDGLSIGDRTFNFSFEDGHELDFHLCNDKNNKPSIRVFWEQW